MNRRLYGLAYMFILISSISVRAQIIVTKLTFQEGLQKIKEDNKLLMVIMDTKDGSIVNQSTDKALLDTNATDINKIAIVIRPAIESPDWDSLYKKYFTPFSFGTLFFNPKGVLVHRYDAINEHGFEYLVQANYAYVRLNMPTENEQLDSLVKIHFSDLKMFNTLFDTRKRSKESIDDLLDPFITNTPIDSFESYNYYYLLARFAPQLSSKADSIFRGTKNFNTNWYKISPPERSDINHEIVKKTMNAAVTNKDEALANRLANFSSNTLANVPEFKKVKEQFRIMTDYYYKIHDTSQYLMVASVFIDSFYMPMSIDSLKQVYIEQEKNRYEKEGKQTLYVNGAKSDNMAYYAEFSIIGSLLNRHAWEFYKITKNVLFLKKALNWAKRSIEYNKTPYAMDTYAELLYVTGDRKSAISAEKDALTEYKKQKLDKSIPKIERVLDNMKKGVDPIIEE